MPAIHHARPVFARVLPAKGSGHGDVHVGVRFHSGPAPTHAFCGAPLDHTVRTISSLFDGALDPAILCASCSDGIDRAADSVDKHTPDG